MMVALGTDLVVLFHLLADESGAAAFAAHEQPLRDPLRLGIPVPGVQRPRSFLGHGYPLWFLSVDRCKGSMAWTESSGPSLGETSPQVQYVSGTTDPR